MKRGNLTILRHISLKMIDIYMSILALFGSAFTRAHIYANTVKHYPRCLTWLTFIQIGKAIVVLILLKSNTEVDIIENYTSGLLAWNYSQQEYIHDTVERHENRMTLIIHIYPISNSNLPMPFIAWR